MFLPNRAFSDQGKKWFAFSRFETGAIKMLEKLKERAMDKDGGLP